MWSYEYDAPIGGDGRTVERASPCQLSAGINSLFYARVYHIWV